jgi:hypothetical protein
MAGCHLVIKLNELITGHIELITGLHHLIVRLPNRVVQLDPLNSLPIPSGRNGSSTGSFPASLCCVHQLSLTIQPSEAGLGTIYPHSGLSDRRCKKRTPCDLSLIIGACTPRSLAHLAHRRKRSFQRDRVRPSFGRFRARRLGGPRPHPGSRSVLPRTPGSAQSGRSHRRQFVPCRRRGHHLYNPDGASKS